ncbi:hypothetical protein ES703_98437 [subsurface metagenome]
MVDLLDKQVKEDKEQRHSFVEANLEARQKHKLQVNLEV